MDLSHDELKTLNEAIESGIIDISSVREELNNKRRQQLLAQHPYSIFQIADGRWRTTVPDERQKSKRRMITKKRLEDLEDAIIDAMQHDYEPRKNYKGISVVALYPEWLKYKNLDVASTTISRIESEFKKYYKDDSLMGKPITELKKIDLEFWLKNHIHDEKMTKTQFYNFSQILRGVLSFAVDLEIIESNPMDKIKINSKKSFRKTRKKNDETQVFSPEEVAAIEKMAWDDFRNAVKTYELAPLAVLFQLQTGVRIGELVVLRYEDIERDRYIHVQRMYRRDDKEVIDHPKTDAGDRDVYLTDKAMEIIEAAHHRQIELGVESDGYIFSINGKPLGYAATSDLYVKYSKKCCGTVKSSHKARKTYISALQDGNVNINTVRQMAGHTDERTTLNNYTFDRHKESERNEMIETALNGCQKKDTIEWTQVDTCGHKSVSKKMIRILPFSEDEKEVKNL